MKRLAFGLLFLTALTQVGCQRELEHLIETVEGLTFKAAGVTLLSNPASVSIKELRLSGNSTESEVVISGKVEERSDNSTYFVISDDSARMLVVTTDLTPRMSEVVFKGADGSTVKVIGRVEIGRKGLPFLKASAVTALGDAPRNGSKS
jgi:hypothetical protein